MFTKVSLNDVLNFEVDQFKKEFGKKIDFHKLNSSNVDQCLKYALDDALRQNARSKKEQYKDLKEKIISNFTDDFIKVANGGHKISNELAFEKLFDELEKKFSTVLKDQKLKSLSKIGFAQKFINMSFKYLYCFEECDKNNLRFCHLPLDKYTINWYKTIGDKNNIADLKEINFSWSKINEDLYFNIQKDIDSKLKSCLDYEINCKDPKQRIQLPQFKIEVEFIVWKQEQLNEFCKKLSKFKDYFERLGIKAI